MATEKIGIKLADGRFYPILNSDEPKKRRLVLTTVSTEQDRAQIDLYRGAGETMEGAEYVGSVILEDLAEAGDEREIELVVGLDEDGIVSARATESASGLYQSLSVSLEGMPEDERLELPDFDDDFEDADLDFDADLMDEELDEAFGQDLGSGAFDEVMEPPAPDESTAEEDLFGDEEEQDWESEPPRRFSPIALLIYLLLAAAVLAALTYGVFRLLESEPIPPLEALLPFVLLRPGKRRGAD
ncbi:MAG: hypothetical protein ACLFP6_03880 [Spirochaetaceae bacterium]